MTIKIAIISKNNGQTRVTIPRDVVRETGFDKFDLAEFRVDEHKHIIIKGFNVPKNIPEP